MCGESLSSDAVRHFLKCEPCKGIGNLRIVAFLWPVERAAYICLAIVTIEAAETRHELCGRFSQITRKLLNKLHNAGLVRRVERASVRMVGKSGESAIGTVIGNVLQRVTSNATDYGILQCLVHGVLSEDVASDCPSEGGTETDAPQREVASCGHVLFS
jgi:hypothetical protein